MTALAPLLLIVFPAALVIAALRDATTFTIPNWLCAAAALLFFPAALASGLAPLGYLMALGMFVATLAAGMGMFALGWIGGGDAKLFAACGLWLGSAAAIFPFLAWTAIAGGALAVFLLMARKWAPGMPYLRAPWIGRLFTPGENVPYGVAIAVGALIAFPQSPVMQALSRMG